jgi:energy-coupling factor transporter ATP-binding protein EcfA2
LLGVDARHRDRMIILELACLGIRSFRQVTKLPLKPGLNLIHGRTGAGKTTLFGCLQVLLFGTPPDQLGLSAKDAAGPAQAAVTVRLRKGDIFRVISDFTKGAFQILRWESGSRAFTPISSDPSALAQLWEAECGGMALADVRDAVLWSPAVTLVSGNEDLPAFTPVSVSEAPAPPTVLTPQERAAKVARLAELQTSLVRAERLAKTSDERSEAVAREAQTRNRVAALDALVARRVESAGRKDEMAPFLQGSKDLDALLDGYVKALPALEEERTALQEDAEGVAAQIEEAGATPLLKAPLFLAGAGLTGISFVVALVRTTWEWLPVLYGIGLAIGVTMVVTALLLDFRRLARKRALETKHAELQKKASRLEDKLKKTYAAPIALIAQTGSGDVETFKAKRRAAKEWAAEQDRFIREEAEILAGKTRADLEADWRAAKAKAAELTREAGEDVDLESIRDAIGHLTRELDGSTAASTPASTTDASHNGGPHTPLREYASDIDGCVAKLTNARLVSVCEHHGVLCVKRRDVAEPVPLNAISHGETIQARVAVVLGAWAGRRNGLGFPLILDDPLAGLDPQGRKALLDTMVGVVGDRQIIVLSNAPVPEMAGVAQTALTVG